MPQSAIVVNADGPDTRVALIENGILSELYVERDRERGTVGNVYKGRVLRVLPGMQAAFVDIGEEKAAFLYAGDIAPKDGSANEEETKVHEGSGIPRRTGKPGDIAGLVRPGQEILVQVVKDPISNKGARITSYVSLPGRNVVFMPTVSHIGISRRINTERDRRRLRRLVDQMRPKGAGFIVRTVAENASNGQVRADMDYLLRLWANIKVNERINRAPVLLYRDLDLALRVIRDNLTPELDSVIVDDRVAHDRIVRFVKTFMPAYAEKVELYPPGREAIFDGYGIELEIDRALERQVGLKSGGSLIFDQGEALTAIDVNTGKFVGSKGKTLEQTITQTNLEAAEEIGDQLRLRNLGGLVIIDFIDMDKESNRRKVYRKLQDVLRKDRAKAHITKISEMGLVEMSRKRTRESLGRLMTSSCSYCNGKGYTKSAATIAYEILRQIRREAAQMVGDAITVNANAEVAELMRGDEANAVDETVKRVQRAIEVHSRKGFHIEQFEIKGKVPGKASRGRGGRGGGKSPEPSEATEIPSA